MKGTEEKGCEERQWKVWCGAGAGSGRGRFHLLSLSWWSVLSFHAVPVPVTTTATKGGHGHCSCFIPIAISLSSSSAFTSLQPKVSQTLHPARRNPTQLLTFYSFCFPAHGWADEIFSAHPPQIRGSCRRGQPGKSCLKPFQPCLPTFPCWRSGPCLPEFLCNTFAVIFP